MKTVHMMIGIQGSGKTTYAEILSKEKGYNIVSTDIIRKNNPGIDEKEVWPMAYQTISNILENKDDVIFDATNITKKVRDRFKENVKKYYDKDFVIKGYYFPTEVNECVKRVEKRNQKEGELNIPLDVVESYGKNIYPPTYEEDFIQSEVISQKANLLKGLVDDAYQGYALYFRKGDNIVEEYSGFANINTNEPIRHNTNFRLASVTKQFIAYGIMTLINKGLLSFDDKLFHMFDSMPEYTKTITIRNLLNHTSGIRDYEDMEHTDEQIHDEDVLNFVRNTKDQYFKTNDRYQYSNTAYVLLGLIIERVSNKKLGDYLEEVFKKHHMLNTKMNYEPNTPISPRAYGHVEENGKLVLKDQYWCSATLGDGGIYSSIDDLKNWLNVIKTLDKPFDEMIKTHIINGSDIEYGLGLRVKKLKNYPIIYHCGETIGTNTIIGYIKNLDIDFIFLTNKGDKDASILLNNLEKEI